MNRRPTLRRRAEFQRVYRRGVRAQHEFLQVRAFRRDDSEPVKLGIVIRGQIVRHSVRRNRIRRLLREAWRTLIGQMAPGQDIVLIPQGEPAHDGLAYVLEVLTRVLIKAKVLPAPPTGDA